MEYIWFSTNAHLNDTYVVYWQLCFFHDYSMYALYSLQIPEILRGMTTGSLLTLVSANRSLSVPRPSLFSPPFNRAPTLLVCASGWGVLFLLTSGRRRRAPEALLSRRE